MATGWVGVALLTAVGVLRRASWARLLVYAVVGWAALLGTAVAAMGLVMVVNDDPAASPSWPAGSSRSRWRSWPWPARRYDVTPSL